MLAGKEEVSQLLLEHSVDLEVQDINHRTPLHMVAYTGLSKVVRILLERSEPLKARLNARDKNGRTPLHLASLCGRSDIARILLKFGADVDVQDSDTMTPLLLVSQYLLPPSRDDSQITKTARLLLVHGANVHVRDKNGQVPLHAASHHDLSGIVTLLLTFGADVDAQDNHAMTPLLLVSQRCSGNNSQIPQTTRLLLEHGASVHVRDKVGQMPLHKASHRGLSGIVGLLLKFGADVDAQDSDFMTPLSLLSQCRWGDDSQITKTAQLLLEHGASVYLRNKDGQTPLHIASHHGRFGIAGLLLKFGADVDARDDDSTTPLCLLSQCRWGNDSQITKTAQLLLEHGASSHLRNKNGQIPLHIASHHGRPGIVELLLELDADVDAQDNESMTPLLLVSQYRLPPLRDDSRITKVARLLLVHGASVHMRARNGQMPLHTASHYGLSGIVALLLIFGADVDAQDNDSMTPLHLASQYNWGDNAQITKAAQMLLVHGASVHVRDNNGRTPLHTASHHGLSSIVALLLKFGADVNAQDNDAMTPLLLVSQYQWGDNSQMTKTVQLLLEHGANVHMRNRNGQMSLHKSSHHGLSGIVALLLKFGADVDAQDNDTMTPLLFASRARRHDFDDDLQITNTARLLLEHGASVHVRDKNGQIPLHTASHHGLSDIVALLLKFGADVEARDNDSMTPLLLVSQCRWGGNSQVAKTAQLLLDHGASVHERDKDGQMPLHKASYHGISDIIELLLKFGADVDAHDNDAMTPLLLVSQCHRGNNSRIAKAAQLLLENGASVHVRDNCGQMPLHKASYHGISGIVRSLLKFGAEVDAHDNDTMTPLFLVFQCHRGNNSRITKTARVLLDHGANVHERDKNGQMPIHKASQHCLSRIVEVLLKLGADVNAQDNNNITPLHFAVSSSFQRGLYKSHLNDSPVLWSVIKTTKLLLEHGANLQMQNDNGETPFQVALMKGEQNIIDVLSDYLQNRQAM